MKLTDRILDLLFPPKCAVCAKLLEDGEKYVCPACAKKLPLRAKAKVNIRGGFFTDAAAPLKYTGDAAEALRRFKFGGRRGSAEFFAHMCAKAIREELSGKFDVITWAPVSRKRMKERGYDQSYLIASKTAKLLGAKCVRYIKKVKDNPPQSLIKDDAARRANAANAYEAVNDPRGVRVLVIDDVITSGATLSECARVLKTAGAESVVVCTAFAREK